MSSHVTRRDMLIGGSAALVAPMIPSAAAVTTIEPTKPPTLKKLLERGEPETYTGQDLRYIGMPVGGLFAGTLYLGGDGQLWNWDIFNQGFFGCIQRQDTVFMGETLNAGGGANYVDPVKQTSPFNQSFQLLNEQNRKVRFGQITFRGEYPVAKIAYQEADSDVEMTLEAFSPFTPLDAESSSYPATTQTYKVKNIGKTRQSFHLRYESENPVLIYSRATRSDFDVTGEKIENGFLFKAKHKPFTKHREDILFEDWSSGTYDNWTKTGDAFGDRPYKVTELPSYVGNVRAGTTYVVNSHQTRNGENVEQADGHIGTLTSPTFTIDRAFILFRTGGGNHPGKTCINLVVENKIVRTVTGKDSNVMRWENFNVAEFTGKKAHIEVIDNETGGWGQISLGEVIFTDVPHAGEDLELAKDFGEFAVVAISDLPVEANVAPNAADCGVRLTLEPGESKEVTFIVAWWFPNCSDKLPGQKNWYASRWHDAKHVAEDLKARWRELSQKTRDWNRTWYDSTLPYWFLDRTFANTSTLATTTCHRLDNGRYYFWEGVGCCAGTCTHVWGYAQAIGRLFPEVERYLRQEVDFGRFFHKDSGVIDYRGEFGTMAYADGQASCILRAYREHQMSPSGEFLKSIWPQVKRATEYLIAMDPEKRGILSGPQWNTLDTAWFGDIAWTSSLYLAALQASAAMATIEGDHEFAKACTGIAEKGSQALVKELFNSEYFINKVDPAHLDANNTNIGCHIDQIYGQSWAMQVGLPRVVPKAESLKALKSLFKYNFYDDVWEYRRKQREIPGGRWYAAPKEGGLIMCSFPHGGAKESVAKGGDAWAVMYFNECMSGFEYQVANHMIAEGMLYEGLRIVHAIHSRYSATKRNPYNEIECSDHYGRALASYGAFIAMTGFLNDGPNHKMSFNPKLGGEFKCAFVNEKGWGTYHRTSSGESRTSYATQI